MDNPWRPSFDPSRLTKASAADYSSSSEESDDEPAVPGINADDDEFRAHNPRKRRRLGGTSKEKSREKAALGVFGSDSDEERPSQRWKSKTLRSRGVNFVSKDEGESEEKKESDSESERPTLGNGHVSPEDDDDDEDNVGVGLGFGKAARAAGFGMPVAPQMGEKPLASTFKTSFDGNNVLGRGFVPSSANQPVLKDPESNESSGPRNKPQPSAFGPKGKVNAKSFGARMMAKMGYVAGKGLGKEGQGRNVIVEANLRPQGVGLGAVKEKTEYERQEEKRQARLRGEEVIDSDEEKKRRKKAKNKSLGIAGGSGASTPRRQKTRYLTAEELKATAPGLHIPEAFTPILDMTGPGGKMITSTSGVMTPNSGVSESSEIVEVRKLVKRAQADLLAFSEEWKSLEERKSWLNLELREREQEIEALRSDFEKLQAFSTLATDHLAQASDWDQTIDYLRKAIDLGSINSETADVAVAVIHPFLKTSDPKWNPLKEPDRFVMDLKHLSSLFTDSGLGEGGNSIDKWDSAKAQNEGVYRRHQKSTTSYETMMYKNWLPQVLGAIREWDVMRPTPMLSIIENWNDLLPAFVRAEVMRNIAVKLETTVSDWNPRRQRASHVLPHIWLFPWLPFLPAYHLDPKGTGVVAHVRKKYRQLIADWKFERGVVPGLEQWRETFGDQWRPLVMSNILPAMGDYLRRKFMVDPADQEPSLPVLTGVLEWQTILGPAVMTEVLVQHVFPKWHEALRVWLADREPDSTDAKADLGEVADWYTWWRRALLNDMSSCKRVEVEFDKGLRVINLF